LRFGDEEFKELRAPDNFIASTSTLAVCAWLKQVLWLDFHVTRFDSSARPSTLPNDTTTPLSSVQVSY
jgi:hypothetical protein